MMDGLFGSAVQLASLASNAGKVIDGYNDLQNRLSASERTDGLLAIADYDTVVIVANPTEVQAYRRFFEEKKLSLKELTASGYNERAFDVAVKMGTQVSKEKFIKVQNDLPLWQKFKIKFEDW